MKAWGQSSDIVLIGDLARNMLGRTFCPLGDAAALPTISFVEKFGEEFEAHLERRSPCPYEKISSACSWSKPRAITNQWLIW